LKIKLSRNVNKNEKSFYENLWILHTSLDFNRTLKIPQLTGFFSITIKIRNLKIGKIKIKIGKKNDITENDKVAKNSKKANKM